MALERFGVSMEESLLRSFDERIQRAGYTNRSEALRDLVRDYLVRQDWASADAEVVGTVTLVYDHHTRLLEKHLTELQHEHAEHIVCATHVHLDHHNCLEVIVVTGTASKVRLLADRLIGARGVKHGALTCTTTGRGL